jgi:cell division septal protein FtsQ
MPAQQNRFRKHTARSGARLAGLRPTEPPVECEPQDSGASKVWSKLLAMTLVIGSIWLLYTLFYDGRFRVSALTVEGNKLVSTEQVRQILEVEGQSIFRLRTNELEGRLRASFGCLQQASVISRLPNQVYVTLEEHEAVMIWESGGNLWWIDGQGHVLGQTSTPGDLVVVRDVESIAPTPQGYLVGAPVTLVRGLAQALPAVKRYDYTRQHGVILYVTDQAWPVYLGTTGDAEHKAALTRALAEELLNRRIAVEYLDLRNERRPVFKRR